MLLLIIIFNLITILTVHIRGKQILSNKKRNIYRTTNCIKEYFVKIESKLSNLNYPYKLTKKKYLIIKYLCSTIIFLISFINYKTLKVPLILFIVVFLIPDYLIYSFVRKEKQILIGELNGIVSSLILSLSAFSPLSNSLEIAGKSIKYKRLKDAYVAFTKIYVMNGYNLKDASRILKQKFNSYELTLFLTTLIQSENEGEIIESLERYKEVLEINYFKYLKRKGAIKVLYVTLGTVVALINLVLVVMYPIIMQVFNNLQLIFD